MRVDVDVRDALQSVATTQRFDHYAAVVEDTEASGAIARRVMQPANGHEGTAPRPGHDPIGSLQAAAHHAGSRLVDTAKVGRIAAIEHAAPVLGTALHEVDMSAAVEHQQFIDGRLGRIELRHPEAQAALVEFLQERPVAVGTERVPAREAVTTQPFAHGDGGLRFLVNSELPRQLPPQPTTSTTAQRPRAIPWHRPTRFKDNARPATVPQRPNSQPWPNTSTP